MTEYFGVLKFNIEINKDTYYNQARAKAKISKPIGIHSVSLR